MKKKLLIIAVLIIFLSPASSVWAKSSNLDNSLKIAIKKYKAGNYTGCLQDCQNIVAKNPSNKIAHYYIAISYVQAGKKDEAINAYNKVLNLKPNTTLYDYATRGKICLENPSECNTTSSDLDKFINQNSSTLSPDIKKEINQRNLNQIKEDINRGKELDDYIFKKLNDASENKLFENNEKLAYNNPNQQEIEDALNVLKKAGINVNLTQNQNQVQTQAQTFPEKSDYDYDLEQIQAFLGTNTQGKNNSMLDMLPQMLTQNKGDTSNYNPQMIQAIIMNSMMSNFDFNINDNK